MLQINSENSTDVDLVKNLLDPSFNSLETIEPDEKMTLINNDSQTNSRQLHHSHSTSVDFHHLYHNSTSVEGQSILELERLRKLNAFLINKIQFYRIENKKIVDKTKEQLSTIRSEKSHEEQLNSMKSQILNQEQMIKDLTNESKTWKEKYLNLDTKHQKLIEDQSREQVEFIKKNKQLKNRNDELEIDLERCSDEKKELNTENNRLNNKLFNATTELEQIKKNFASCESLRKDRLRAQQKCHVISEKLEACKIKCEQSTNLLKEKSCLVNQQIKEIKDLNLNIIDLKKVNSLNQLEIEKNKIRIEELERKLKDKDDLLNEYRGLYYEIKNTRENEIKHEQQTIKALVMINSRYETEMAQMKADLEKIHYDKIVNSNTKPDLIEDNAEHDRLDRLKKKYNALKNDLDEFNNEVYEIDETLNANSNEQNGLKYNQQNGDHHSNNIIAKKEALIKQQFQNGNARKEDDHTIVRSTTETALS